MLYLNVYCANVKLYMFEPNLNFISADICTISEVYLIVKYKL